MRVFFSCLMLVSTLALAACGDDGNSTYDPGTGGSGGTGGGGTTLPEDVGAPPLNPGWAIMSGDIDDDWGLGITADADGNVYVVGYFRTAIDFGEPLTGTRSAFVTSFANDGTHRWSHAFGGQGSSEAWDVAELGGTLYVTGEASGEVDFGLGATTGSDEGFVAAIDAITGDTQWATRFGVDGRVEARGIAATTGFIYAVGTFEGTGDLFGTSLASAGVNDVLVVALGSTGGGLWARGFGSTGVDNANAVALTDDEGPVVVGQIDGAVDFGGGPIGQEQTAFVVSLTQGGEHQQSMALTSPLSARLYDIASDASGNVYVSGDFRESVDVGGQVLTAKGGSDVLLASYDSAGALRFAWNFGDVEDPAMPTFQNGIHAGMGIAFGGDHNVYLTGSFQLTIDFGGGPLTYIGGGGDTDIFVASFQDDGKHRWSRAFGGDRGETGWAIAAANGQAFLTGRSLNALDFGTGALTNAGGDDVYVVRLE